MLIILYHQRILKKKIVFKDYAKETDDLLVNPLDEEKIVMILKKYMFLILLQNTYTIIKCLVRIRMECKIRII